MPGTVLDASEGPIIMCDNVQIMPHSFIQGPCFIGKNSIIKAGSQIYGKTVIGPFVRLVAKLKIQFFMVIAINNIVVLLGILILENG